jgi:hypothetical protein
VENKFSEITDWSLNLAPEPLLSDVPES